jgi:hypothetical protein
LFRYAGLFFTFGVDIDDNELGHLEAIHLFVEILDQVSSECLPLLGFYFFLLGSLYPSRVILFLGVGQCVCKDQTRRGGGFNHGGRVDPFFCAPLLLRKCPWFRSLIKMLQCCCQYFGKVNELDLVFNFPKVGVKGCMWSCEGGGGGGAG